MSFAKTIEMSSESTNGFHDAVLDHPGPAESPLGRLYAWMLNLHGLRIQGLGDSGWVRDEALSADRPVVLNARTDPDLPPLPPYISDKQARGYMPSMIKSDPATWHALKQTFKTMSAELR